MQIDKYMDIKEKDSLDFLTYTRFRSSKAIACQEKEKRRRIKI